MDRSKTNSKITTFFILSLLFGISIAIYIRFILHDGTVWATDEGSYLRIITLLNHDQIISVSGPLYIWIIESLQWLLNSSLINSQFYFSLISSCLLPALFFIFYHSIIKHNSINLEPCQINYSSFAFICLLMLLSSSYFIWSMIEGRPQQLGSLIMITAFYLYYQQLLNASFPRIILLILLASILFYYHILSFIFFISMASMLWFWLYISRQSSFISIFLPLIIIIASLFAFTEKNGVYYHMFQDLLRFHLKGIDLKQAGIALGLLIFTAFLLQKPILYLVSLTKSALKTPYFIIILILLSTAALMVQINLLGPDIFYFYRDSKITFIIFQLGNIFFMVCYFFGLYHLNRQSQLNNFFVISSFLFLILAAFSIVISFYLGHKNLLLRLLGFWVLFAAPIASISLIKLYQFHWGGIIILPIAILLSIILSSKSGQFFNFEDYWDNNDIEAIEWACQHPQRYKIIHTERQLKYFAKEHTYYKLKAILCPGEKLALHPVQQSCKKPVYQKGYIQICL